MCCARGSSLCSKGELQGDTVHRDAYNQHVVISQRQRRLFNLGGPERLSRADMAFTVANIWGYSTAAIEVSIVHSCCTAHCVL